METKHVTAGGHGDLSLFERFLMLFTRVRAGEGAAVAVLFAHSFLVLSSYYLVRPLREALILSEGSAELRSYASAFQAATLLVLIPLYGWLVHRQGSSLIIQRVNIFFALNLVLFGLLGLAGVRFGFVFFIWVGIYSVMVIAQFWAFAADLLNVKAGQRLFAVIGVGGSLGAVVGARLSGWLLDPLGPGGPYWIMLIASLVLSITLVLSRLATGLVPPESRAIDPHAQDPQARPSWLGGFRLVFRSHYLIAIAALVVMLNWIMSNGDYILSHFVKEAAATALGAGASRDDSAHWMGEFFSTFFTWINAGAFLLQLFVVARVFLWAGVHVAILVLPMIMAGSFLTLEFLPSFLLAQVLLGTQKTLDYSLMNTTRNALFLPTTKAEKYEGKTAIDTFFMRFGDMFSGLAVFAATSIGIGRDGFVTLNIALSLLLFVLAAYIGRRYRSQAASEAFNKAPLAHTPIPDAYWTGAGPFMHAIPPDAFIDADAGDLLHVQLRGADEPLPGWIRYEERTLTIHCDNPPSVEVEIRVVAVARDFDGLEATSTFVIRRVPRT